MEIKNKVEIKFEARSVNEGFARLAVAAFMMDMNPTLDELEDVKTAVSEAVTNAIVHGYMTGDENFETKEAKGEIKVQIPMVDMICQRYQNLLVVKIKDSGVGIENIEEARQPFFTTKPDMERSGMGFSFMETFMDEVEVKSKIGEGTTVIMKKYIGSCGGSEQ